MKSDTNEINVKIYTPDSSILSPLTLFRGMAKDLRGSHELAWCLAKRDISAQYRQTILGLLWAFILPLFNALFWMFLTFSGIVSLSDTALPYPVYVFTGTMLWAIFTDAVNSPLLQTSAAKGMLAKLYFPREALIVSGVYQTLFNAGIKMVLLLGTLAIAGIYPGKGLLLFPVGVMSLIFLGTALGVLITPVGMLYADVGRAVPLLLQLVMYVSPVVFPMPRTGWAAMLFTLNPLTPLLSTTRSWLTGTAPDQMLYFAMVSAISLFLLALGWVIYRLSIPIIIERVSS